MSDTPSDVPAALGASEPSTTQSGAPPAPTSGPSESGDAAPQAGESGDAAPQAGESGDAAPQAGESGDAGSGGAEDAGSENKQNERPEAPAGEESRFYRVMKYIADTLKLNNFPTWQQFKDGAFERLPSQPIFTKIGFKGIGKRLEPFTEWVGSQNEKLSQWIGFKDLTAGQLAKLGAKAVAAVGVTALAVKAARSDSVRDAAGDAASAVSSAGRSAMGTVSGAAGALKQKVMGAPASDRADDEGFVEGGQAVVREKKSPPKKRKSLAARARARVHRSDEYKELVAQEKEALKKPKRQSGRAGPKAAAGKNGRKSTPKGRKSTSKGRKSATAGGKKGRKSISNMSADWIRKNQKRLSRRA